MGIKSSVAALSNALGSGGASFDHTATIGRQSLTVPVADLAALARRLGIAEPDWTRFAEDGYCEDFFRLFLGTETLTSFDVSAYQNATVVHDFNTPIPHAYTVVRSRRSTAAPWSTSSTSSRC